MVAGEHGVAAASSGALGSRFDDGERGAGGWHAWLVNPVPRTLEILRLRDGSWTLVAAGSDFDVVRAEPFEAIELELARLWPDPAAPAPDADQGSSSRA